MTATKYSVFDNLMEGVQVINRDWEYIYVNDALLRQVNAPKEFLLTDSMTERYPGIESSPLYKHIESCLLNGIAVQLQNEFTFPDGSKNWFDLRIQPVEEGALIFSFDITRQKQMEQELRQLNAELGRRVAESTKELQDSLSREKELNEMKSRFVSMASHEFRAPLSTVLSSVGLIEQYIGTEQTDKKHKHVERIRSAVKNMRVILDDFLSLDKLDQGKVPIQLHTFSLHELVLDIISDFDGTLKPDQQIHYTHKGGERIVLDRQILHNILVNLISNANKYSDQDIEVNSDVNEEEVIITVQDKGIGIPQEEQQQLFEKFFRASNTSYVQGTGLGLNIVKRYAELLHGSIGFNSTQHEGTLFMLHFPVYKQEEI